MFSTPSNEYAKPGYVGVSINARIKNYFSWNYGIGIIWDYHTIDEVKAFSNAPTEMEIVENSNHAYTSVQFGPKIWKNVQSWDFVEMNLMLYGGVNFLQRQFYNERIILLNTQPSLIRIVRLPLKVKIYFRILVILCKQKFNLFIGQMELVILI